MWRGWFVHLASLTVADFRNYASLQLELPAEGAVFRGPNGSGKTNLLESIHVLCMGRSQRGSSRADMIRHGAQAASLLAVYRTSDNRRVEAHIGFDRAGTVSMSRDGVPVATRREWFSGVPVVSLGPDDLRMVAGGPSERRRYLDMLASQVDSSYLEALIRYNKALSNRNRLLGAGGHGELLDIYEDQLSEQGDIVEQGRARIIDMCQEWFAADYSEIAGENEAASLSFRPSVGGSKAGAGQWRDVFYNTLKNNRKRDIDLGYSSSGPHRDDLYISLDKKPARTFASQGQLRSLALALRLCAIRCIQKHFEGPLVVLVDDAFSELDDRRISRVYPLIRQRGQVLMATPVDRIPMQLDIPQFSVSSGTVALR